LGIFFRARKKMPYELFLSTVWPRDSRVLTPGLSKMAKQVKNLLDALQPAAPSVNAFITTLRIGGKPQRESGGPSMFGEAFDDGAVEAIPPSSAGVQGCGAKLAIQFEALRNQLGAPPISLDIWFCELARFTLEPRALFENGAKQRECWTRRQAICEENGVPIRSYKVGSSFLWNTPHTPTLCTVPLFWNSHQFVVTTRITPLCSIAVFVQHPPYPHAP
jgi:hypothetical protein